MNIENIEKYLEPLVVTLLSLAQNNLVEKYVDIIGQIKKDDGYKHILFFWSCVRSNDVVIFNKSYDHLKYLQQLGENNFYDLSKCQQFYEWRKNFF